MAGIAAGAAPRASTFPPADVRVEGGPLKAAQEVDRAYLLKLDPDALLHFVRASAGLAPKADHYGGWESGGSACLGHYLSACSMMWAATGDAELRRRVDYIVDELAQCQAARKDGGLFASAGDVRYFDRLAQGRPSFPRVNAWYAAHKLLAGTRDAYLLTRGAKARKVWLAACDWAVEVSANLTPEQWQQMMDGEHGGPHEVLADAYAETGNRKYLDCALKFRHRRVFDPLLAGKGTALDGLHANTNVAKFVGYERVGEVAGEQDWHAAARNFWREVVSRRTWAIGGNSQWEAFFDPARTVPEMLEVCGPETCNSYNMLKLTRMLYEGQPDAAKVDFYERCLFNHVLPSLNREHGGFAYYTPVRPGAYRTTSTDLGGFWCCVGTGMESHAKHGEMIYARSADGEALYVNLFVPSTLTWRERSLTLRQTTDFPAAGNSTLTISSPQPQDLALAIRYPAWVQPGAMTVAVNGQPADLGTAKPGEYARLRRTWHDGDRISISAPMRMTTEPLPTSTDYAAVLYGPIVLAGEMGREGLKPEDFRPTAQRQNMLAEKKFPETDAPAFVVPAIRLPSQLKPVDGQPLTFTSGSATLPRPVTLVPMWELGDQRYVVYFRMTDPQGYNALVDAERLREAAETSLERRTLDRVRIGSQQSEADHNLRSSGSHTGPATPPHDRWRDATGFLSYDLTVDPARGPLLVRCTYWAGDGGRTFDILVEGQRIATQHLTGGASGGYIDFDYAIPPELVRGKKSVTVRLEPRQGPAGGLFDLRLIADH